MLSSILRFTVFFAVIFGALVGALRLTCLRWWQVPTDDPDLAASIAPTLAPGDWIILWRGTSPGFGDLVLCPDPDDPAQVVIARVAGEGGDHLEVDSVGQIKVNGSRFRSEQACSTPKVTVANPRTGDEVELRCDIESLGGVHHRRALVPSNASLEPRPFKTEVAAGSVFLVSDNRFYPFDSRDFGPLAKASCSETVRYRLVSRLGFSDVAARLSWIH